MNDENSSSFPHRIIALSPSEESGLAIKYALFETSYGTALIASTSRGITFIGLGEEKTLKAELKQRYSSALIIAGEEPLHRRALALINNPRKSDPLPLHIRGTLFQLAVWNQLLQIPCGETTHYGTIAEQIGKPHAAQAVGTAVGKNPVACLIPCHRVVRIDHRTGGYHWGPERKEQMLLAESTLHL